MTIRILNKESVSVILSEMNQFIGLRLRFTTIFMVAGIVMLMTSYSALGQMNEIGFELGAFGFTGDLSKNYQLKSQRPAAAVFLRTNISDGVGLKYGISGGMLSGINQSPDDATVPVADQTFQVYLLDAFVLFEFYFLDYKSKHAKVHWTPYLNFGVGAFTFFGEVAKNTDYSRIQPAIPFGFGFKYQVNKKLDLGVEAGARATFFDGLDGVADNNASSNDFDYGNKYNFDSYYFIGFTINYTFYFIPCPYGYN